MAASAATTSAPLAGKEFVISRVFDAPRDLVWSAWTQGERLAQWWGPKGSKIRVLKLEMRPGGIFHYRLEFPKPRPSWAKPMRAASSIARSRRLSASFSSIPSPTRGRDHPRAVQRGLAAGSPHYRDLREERKNQAHIAGHPIDPRPKSTKLSRHPTASIGRAMAGPWISSAIILPKRMPEENRHGRAQYLRSHHHAAEQ